MNKEDLVIFNLYSNFCTSLVWRGWNRMICIFYMSRIILKRKEREKEMKPTRFPHLGKNAWSLCLVKQENPNSSLVEREDWWAGRENVQGCTSTLMPVGFKVRRKQLYNNPQRLDRRIMPVTTLNAQSPVQDLIAVHIIVINYYSVNMLHKLSFFSVVCGCKTRCFVKWESWHFSCEIWKMWSNEINRVLCSLCQSLVLYWEC